MKICPYCSAENYEDAGVCYRCGRTLAMPQAPVSPGAYGGDAGDTQPLRPRGTQPNTPAGAAGPTGPIPPARPTSPYGPSSQPNDPYAGGYPPPRQVPMQEPFLPGSTQGYRPQPQPQVTLDPSPYIAPGYGAETYPARPRRQGISRFWGALVVWLGLALLCGGGLALWTMSSAAGSFGARISTQVAEVMATPTPLPSPTPLPTATPQVFETPTPDPTQESAARKLLSPECAGALDHLGSLSDQMKTDPSIPLNANWRDELSGAVGEMKTACGTLESASPVPGQIAEAQRNLDLATTEFDTANRLLKEGVDEWNPGKIWEAGGKIRQAGAYLSTAAAELRKIGQ